MNHFENEILPELWKQAHKGVVSDILSKEIKDYHVYDKNPDTGENFRRFYRHTELLHKYLAKQVAKSLLLLASESVIQKRIDSYLDRSLLQSFFDKCSKIVVLKGTITLAHGEVLLAQISALSKEEKNKVGLILIDYRDSTHLSADKLIPEDVSCLFLGHIQNLKDQ